MAPPGEQAQLQGGDRQRATQLLVIQYSSGTVKRMDNPIHSNRRRIRSWECWKTGACACEVCVWLCLLRLAVATIHACHCVVVGQARGNGCQTRTEELVRASSAVASNVEEWSNGDLRCCELTPVDALRVPADNLAHLIGGLYQAMPPFCVSRLFKLMLRGCNRHVYSTTDCLLGEVACSVNTR